MSSAWLSMKIWARINLATVSWMRYNLEFISHSTFLTSCKIRSCDSHFCNPRTERKKQNIGVFSFSIWPMALLENGHDSSVLYLFSWLAVFLFISQLFIFWHLTPLFLITSSKQVHAIIINPIQDNDRMRGNSKQQVAQWRTMNSVLLWV